MPEDEFYTKGVYLFQQKKYEKAIKNFDKVIQNKPDFESAWFYKSKCQYALNNYEDAKFNIDRALELNPSSPDSLLSKLEVLLKIGTYEEALDCCNKLLNIRPNKYWLQLVYVHERFKNFKKALDCAEKALEYNPNSTKVLRTKSVLKTALKYGNNYHVPVARSRLLRIIPQGEEVVYSTSVGLSWHIIKGDGKRKTSFPSAGILRKALVGLSNYYIHTERDKGTIITDVLITHKGLALLLPTLITDELYGMKEPFSFQYLPWKNVTFSTEHKMVLNKEIDCELNHIPFYESEDDYMKRKNSVYKEIIKLRHQYTKECIERANFYLNNNEVDNALTQVESGFMSNIYRSQFDLNDELTTINATILKKMEIEKIKMLEELENVLINYLKLNQGQAFTPQSLTKRLDNEIENSKMLEYLRKEIEGLLNKLVFSRKIKSNQHEGKKYYFF